MRINHFVASATGISRRAADKVVASGAIMLNGHVAQAGEQVTAQDAVTWNGKILTPPAQTTTILLNKPVGYVCSRDGQGSKTIYDLLPSTLHNLKTVGRLDKNSSGLLLMTNDGQLAHQLTHPSFQKVKIYEVTLNKNLEPLHRQMISEHGIMLEDGRSQFALERLHDEWQTAWRITMREGRNRQIRRTFEALGYTVTRLHRTHFGTYALNELLLGTFTTVAAE